MCLGGHARRGQTPSFPSPESHPWETWVREACAQGPRSQAFEEQDTFGGRTRSVPACRQSIPEDTE